MGCRPKSAETSPTTSGLVGIRRVLVRGERVGMAPVPLTPGAMRRRQADVVLRGIVVQTEQIVAVGRPVARCSARAR